MIQDKSDANVIHQPFVSDVEILPELLAKRYPLTKPLNQMSVVDFVRITVLQDYKKELKILRGNSNTACPTYQQLPNGILQLYISDERTLCGQKQLLYFYFQWGFNSLPLKSELIYELNKRRIDDIGAQPFHNDMDENDRAMTYTKIMLKIF